MSPHRNRATKSAESDPCPAVDDRSTPSAVGPFERTVDYRLQEVENTLGFIHLMANGLYESKPDFELSPADHKAAYWKLADMTRDAMADIRAVRAVDGPIAMKDAPDVDGGDQ